jgi:hypothetical protein
MKTIVAEMSSQMEQSLFEMYEKQAFLRAAKSSAAPSSALVSNTFQTAWYD